MEKKDRKQRSWLLENKASQSVPRAREKAYKRDASQPILFDPFKAFDNNIDFLRHALMKLIHTAKGYLVINTPWFKKTGFVYINCIKDT